MDLHSSPPPIPPPVPPQRTGHHRAALVGLLAPMIVLIIVLILRSAGERQAQNQVLMAIAGLLTLLLIGAGLVCAVVALCGIRSSGRKGLLGPGLVGAVLNGAFVVFIMFAFVQVIKKAVANQQGMQQLVTATHELNRNAGDDFNPTNGINGQAEVKKLDQFRNQLNALTNQLSGEDAELMNGLNVCLAHWSVEEKKFLTAATAFQKSGALNFKTLDTKEQLAGRQQAVQSFLDANEQFRTSLLSQESELKSELGSRKISTLKLDQFMTGFRSTHEPVMTLATQVRDCDKLVGGDCLQLLDLAEKQWGSWTADPVETIRFNDQKIQASAKMIIEDINYQARKEISLQRQVIQIQKASNGDQGQ